MIIKLIPETEQERQHFAETQHENISDFFVMGTKNGDSGKLEDFHEWNGQYRYLIGNLYYFASKIEREEAANEAGVSKVGLPQIVDFAPLDISPEALDEGDAEEESKIEVVLEADDIRPDDPNQKEE